jgi:hypothetical protein
MIYKTCGTAGRVDCDRRRLNGGRLRVGLAAVQLRSGGIESAKAVIGH